MIKDIYKDLDKEDSPENIEKRIQEELLKARKEAKKKQDIQCSICMTNKKQICLDCGHLFCKACSEKLVGKCFICKKSYTKLLRIYL